ncbi:ATP-binding protein [Metabacillus fastidiosus]|uniref:sensor histidine kinase n=1 Tax=Metabacillus fastidiosus TaxID=1458 RepID=UPI003D28777E
MILKKRKFIALIILGLYLALHTYLITVMSQPYSGVIISIDSDENIIVERIHNSGWAKHTNITKGDIIKEADGKTIGKQQNFFIQKHRILYAEKISIENNGKVLNYHAADPVGNTNSLLEVHIPWIFTILTLMLSIFIYQKNNSSANYLIGFLMAASLSLFTSRSSGRDDFGAEIILAFSFQLGALFLLYFLYSIFEEKGIIKRKAVTLLRIDTIFGITVITIKLLNLFFKNIFGSFPATLMLFYFCLNILYAVGFLIYMYIKKRDSHYEPFLKWMLLIKIIAFGPFIFLHAIPFILGLPYLDDKIVALFLFSIPLGYSYLIITRQLLDINFIVNRIRYYTVLSLLPTILLSLIVNIIVSQENDYFARFMQIFFLIFILNILFLFIKEKIDFSFRDRLFQDKTNITQSIDQFAEKLSSMMKADELETFLVNEINSVLNPSIVAMIEYDNKTSTYTSKVVYGEKDQFILDKKEKWIIQYDSKGKLLEHKGALIIRLYKNNEKKTYIWVGHKKNSTTFNLNEKNWIITIIKYSRLAYENLHAVSSLVSSIEKQTFENHPDSVSLSRLLFQLAEKERRRLASDLHDSALQDQIVWYRKLETFINENESLPLEPMEQLVKIKNGMVDVIKQIRSTCNELRPNLLLESGLVKSLEELFSQLQMRVKYNLEYDLDNISDTFDDYNKAISIYRIIQELLNNADKHSEATHVSVNMWEENEMIYIDYCDNGKGFSPQILHKKGNGMGLSGVRERISSINGEAEFISAEGKGLQVYITLPRWEN